MIALVAALTLSAGPHAETVMTQVQRRASAELADALERATLARMHGGPPAEAEALERSLPGLRQDFRATRQHLAILIRLGECLARTEAFARAGSVWDEAHEIVEGLALVDADLHARASLGRSTWRALARLTPAQRRRWAESQHRLDEAIVLMESSPERSHEMCVSLVKECESTLGDAHPVYGLLLVALSQHERRRGRPDEAMLLACRGERILGATLHRGSELYAKAVLALAAAQLEAGRSGLALDTVRRWAEWHERRSGRITAAVDQLGKLGVVVARRSPSAGLEILRLALKAIEAAPVRDDHAYLHALANLGILSANEGRLLVACMYLEKAVPVSRTCATLKDRAELIGQLGCVSLRLGRNRHAAGLLREALDLLKREGGPRKSRELFTQALGNAYAAVGDWENAAACGRDLAALKKAP